MKTIQNEVFTFSINENDLSGEMNEVLIKFIQDVDNVYKGIIGVLQNSELTEESKVDKIHDIFEERTLDRHKFIVRFQENVGGHFPSNSYSFNLKNKEIELHGERE